MPRTYKKSKSKPKRKTFKTKRRTYVRQPPTNYNPLHIRAPYNSLSLEDKMKYQLLNFNTMTVNKLMTREKWLEITQSLQNDQNDENVLV